MCHRTYNSGQESSCRCRNCQLPLYQLGSACSEDLGCHHQVRIPRCSTFCIKFLPLTAVLSSGRNWAKFIVRISLGTPIISIPLRYILKVRKEGGSDAESIRVVKDYSATSHQVSGLDPATLYEILIHTESDKSASMPVKVLQATAPDSIPFPEVCYQCNYSKLLLHLRTFYSPYF